ncbi:MAG: aminotransferase class I/II-fold pyridoxal phosphate-dependent enzyme [Acidimicrobiia bacterium]|nr:aminotransferase class I/II-fold pyridoxal phosphate-dependent enzyme [Acidimicrobiia bacterium]
MGSIEDRVTERALATDPDRLETLFGRSDLHPLWIAEPYVDLAPPIKAALMERAESGWYGYESRPDAIHDAFWGWMQRRHAWDGSDLHTSVSPSVGTSIGVLLEHFSAPGEAVILQPPVFTDFKPLVRAAERRIARNSLQLTDAGYRMDFDDLRKQAADPATTGMILCNPHNPVGRLWTEEELAEVAAIGAANDVFIIADEIHADLVLSGGRFTPFATVAAGSGVRWAAIHGPIKTFGLAGVCDTLLIAESDEVTDVFRKQSSRLHLTRNNVFSMAAFQAAYSRGDEWLDELLDQVAANTSLLASTLPDPLAIVPPEATYLAWLDLRGLGLAVPELAKWLAAAGVAFSPGHWFGREGAGFARMSIAVDAEAVAETVERLRAAL